MFEQKILQIYSLLESTSCSCFEMYFMCCDFYVSPFQTSDMEFLNSPNIIVACRRKEANLIAKPKIVTCKKYLCYTEVESVSALPNFKN